MNKYGLTEALKRMKQFFLIGILSFGIIVNAYAQLELGVEDITGSMIDLETDTEEKENSSDEENWFFGLKKTFNIFSDSSSSSGEAQQTETLEDKKAKAQNGDIEAMLDLGYMYLYGTNGVETNYKQAFTYYKMAADKQNPVALNNLGSLYFNGIGTKRNYQMALKLFEEAANLGSDDAAINLAIIYLGTDAKFRNVDYLKKAIDLLKQASEKNDTGKYLLGYAYYKGFIVERDYNRAFQLIKAAADAQYDEAQFILSDFYLEGRGTPKNYNRAIQYLRMSVAQGNSDAIMRLADILSTGKYYTADISNAYVLYNIASVMGIKRATERRDFLEKKLKIDELLNVQTEAEIYKEEPSELTQFIRQTFGNSLKVYIDSNLN